MFTQCPDCQTTFRVTAELLQQADGRVRCGGCGNAFNALDNMSDGENGQDATESSSNKNKQLLQTLDKLAGPEVTLEDTGVEWRVLKPAGDGKEGDTDATGSLRFVLEGDEAEGDSPAMLGRQEDVPKPVSGAQESLDLSEADAPKASPGERRYDDNTILPDDFGDDDDLDELPFLEKPESPKRRASDRDEIQGKPEFEEAQVDLALGEPDEWEDLLDEVDDEDAPAIETADDEVAEEASAEDEDTEIESVEEEPVADEPPEEDMPSDIDTQFLLQAEEMGLDTGNHPVVKAEDEDDDLDRTDIGDPDAEEEEEDEDEDAELSMDDALALDDEEEEEEEEDEDTPELESTGDFEAQIDVAEKALAGEDEDDDEEASDEPVELELEEESTDADEEEDNEAEDAIATAIRSGKDVSKLFDEDSPMVETIIMEGGMIGDPMNEEVGHTAKPAGTFDNPGPLEDTYSLNRGKVRGGRRASDPPSYMVMASVVVLVVLLLAQIMHQSRQTLATYGAFNQTIGSIYRVLGSPVTPEWDVRGWLFEATSNSVDEEEDLLTIYSRIANKSGQPLPYPLVHISLTDRWEDIIGSRVLEPNEYLAGDLDPSKPVPSGEKFTAVITIESPSAEATGFKLTVCYRVTQGRVRCATQDFKN